jgi:GxxExxY protein
VNNPTNEKLNSLSGSVVDAAFAVHRELGPGLLESTYKACLAYEMKKRGMQIAIEVPVPVLYDGQLMVEVGYRMDILIEGCLIVEVKSQEGLLPVHKAQLLTYLRHANKRLGLLINFSSPLLKNGIVRLANGL